MNKKIFAFDKNHTKDTANIFCNTDILIKDHDTGEIIFRGKNKVIIPGSGLIARTLFDVESEEITPTYNEVLNFSTSTGTEITDPDTIISVANTKATIANNKMLLFCIGTDGCGQDSNQVYEVDYKKWIKPDSLVPFRFGVADLSSSLRDTYFGRSIVSGRYAYYFKRFSDTDGIKFIQQYVDGTAITEATDIYNNTKETDAESYIEIVLKITNEDMREFFAYTTSNNLSEINTVSICSAYPKVYTEEFATEGISKDIVYFEDIRPVTKLNFPNESLIDPTKGIDIIYHIYM